MQVFAHARYLGDGVYASTDGLQIWLMTLEEQRIALEPEVFAKLVTYEQDMRKLAAEQRSGAAP